MTNNTLSFVLVAFLFFCIGCSSTNVVSSSPNADPSFSTFNDDADDRWATIVLQDGRELDAKDVFASPDSTLFLDRNTDLITVVPTHTINKVVITNELQSGLYGFGIGFALGGTFGAIWYEVEGWGTKADQLSVALGFGVLGGGIGALTGLMIGYDYEYQFQTTEY